MRDPSRMNSNSVSLIIIIIKTYIAQLSMADDQMRLSLSLYMDPNPKQLVYSSMWLLEEINMHGMRFKVDDCYG